MFQDVSSQLRKLVEKAIESGASYADVRYQKRDSEVITVENKMLKSYSSRRHSGAGIRVIVNGALGYASTSDLTKDGLERALNSSIKIAKSMKSGELGLGETEANKSNVELTIKEDPFGVPPEEKVSIVMEANKASWIGDGIKSAITRLGITKDFRYFSSSEGAEVYVETCLVGLGHDSVAKVNGVMERVPYSESMCAGFEFIRSRDWNSFTSSISELAIEAAGSKTPPPGTYTVVVDPRIVGLLLHEAFGHASEGDLVASGESVLYGKLDKQVASELVTIIDEGVVEGGYFYPFDDEGVKKRKTIIVENGVLRGYIHDRTSSFQFGVDPTGNGRAQDFENTPIVRQTNYYMQPRDYEFDELIEDIDFGIYVKGMGARGGQVEVGMGTFTFSVGPSKIIRKGELAETVRGVVISGMILETLKTIDAVGKDLLMRTSVFGGCGKMAQSVPVGVGGPHVRVRKMTVGGR